MYEYIYGETDERGKLYMYLRQKQYYSAALYIICVFGEENCATHYPI